MKTCENCGGRLDAVAKCARSPICSGCATEAGDLSATPTVPIFPMRTWADVERLQLPR